MGLRAYIVMRALGWAAASGASLTGAGGAWAIQPTPNPAGAVSSFLTAVSCPAATSCTAVGAGRSASSINQPLAEHWDGTTWLIQRVTAPAGAASSELDGVSCPAAGICTAVGSYVTASGVTAALAERWTGGRWMPQPVPSPAGAQSALLSAVSCPRPRTCVAVGNYTTAAGTLNTLAVRWHGSGWVIQPTPAIAASGLAGVSCATKHLCTAVGSYTNGSGTTVPLAERFRKGRWVVQRTPVPAGALITALTAVSCPGPQSCVAAGWYFNSTGRQVTLAEGWARGPWTIQPTPNAPTSVSFLIGVSCPAEGSCTAVGADEFPSRGQSRTLALQFTGGQWAIQPTPNPAVGNPELSGVSCTADGHCTAAGNIIEPGDQGNMQTLAEHR